MRRHWGTLAGFAAGALGGPLGAVFGLLIGFLVDLVRLDLLAQRATVRFLEEGRADDWFPVPIALAGLLAGHLLHARGPLSSAPGDAAADELRRHYPRHHGRRTAERILATASVHPWPGDESWPALTAALDQAAREDLLRAAWAAVRVAGPTRARRDRARALARSAGLGEEFAAREIVVTVQLDAHACAVLGVARDADVTEIRRAYRRLAAQFHPDTAGGLTEDQRVASERAFKRIQDAYDTVRAELPAEE